MSSNKVNPWNTIVLFAPENMGWESNAEFYFYGTPDAMLLSKYAAPKNASFLRNDNLLRCPFHKPSAEPTGESLINTLKEQMFLLSLDEHREAITGETVISGSGWPEVPHLFDREGSAISPCDRCRQHIAGGIELRCYFHIDTFGLLLSFGHSCHPLTVARTSV